MEYRMPSYYGNFKCIADKCPATCCAGWGIVIDDKTMRQYKKGKGALFAYVRKHVDMKEGVYKRQGGRCTLLTDDNLCGLQMRGGADLLCRTCSRYPRHFEEYGNLVEAALSMSCPVAAEMIVDNPKRDSYRVRSDGRVSPHAGEADAELLDALLYVRRNIFVLADDRTYSLAERMRGILDYGAEVQRAVYAYERLAGRKFLKNRRKEILGAIRGITPSFSGGRLCPDSGRQSLCAASDSGKVLCENVFRKQRFHIIRLYMDMLLGLENIDDNWPALMHNVNRILYDGMTEEEYHHCAGEFDRYMADREYEYEHILNYFLYTYFLGGVYDYNIQAMIKLAILSTAVIRELGMAQWRQQKKIFTVENQIRICYLYSRQVEHSDENLISLEGILTAHPAFNETSLKKII